MREKGLLVRNINAVETIGAVDIVCLDKTGTLTRNRIVPVAAHTAMTRVDVQHDRLVLDGGTVDPADHPALRELLELVVLCNDSS